MNIVLDTNILFENWYLEGPHFLLLEKYLSISESKLFIPEIVVLETKNLFRKELKKLLSGAHKLSRYLPDEQVFKQLPGEQEKYEEYVTKLDERLKELNVERPGHSDIPHDVLIQRDLAYRKPFGQSGKGYTDTLLWEVILQKIAAKETVAFLISKNPGDFAVSKKVLKLHDDLKNDLMSAGLPEDSVRYFSDLKCFIDEIIKPELEPIAITNRIATALKENGVYRGFSVKDWFTNSQQAIIDKVNDHIGDAFGNYRYELEDPSVSCIEDPETMTIDGVTCYDESSHIYHIECSLLADMSIDVLVHKSEYDYRGGNTPLDVWDYDWNESFVWAVLSVNLPLSLSLVFDSSTEVIDSFEVDDIGELWGWCKHCGSQIMSDAAEQCSKCGKSFR